MKSDKEINLGNQNINPHIPEFQFSATRTLLMDCLSVVSAARLFSSFLFSATQLNWASVFFSWSLQSCPELCCSMVTVSSAVLVPSDFLAPNWAA